MEFFEGIDWEAVRELAEPATGLLIALAFMAVIKMMRSARRRPRTPPTEVPTVKAPRLQDSKRKWAKGVAPIEPGDDAAKLANRFSQNPTG